MRWSRTVALGAGAVVLGTLVARTALQGPEVLSLGEDALREYAGAYQWGPGAFVYLEISNEFAGADHLVAVDESGEVRTLFATGRDRFFAGPGTAIRTAVESTVSFQRDDRGNVRSLTWEREGAAPRNAQRSAGEARERVSFRSGDVHLAGTLIKPNRDGRHPAIVLVHGSGPARGESMLTFARFLVRRGIALLAYDKRGVGGSTGDWNTASFEDLASDAVAALDYLQARPDIDGAHIGMMGVSQAGWVMPLAALRARSFAFLISVSGPGVRAAETTIDQAQHEMSAGGMKPQTVSQIVDVMKLQYRFAETGDGWDAYAAARENLAMRLGSPPDTFPASPDHPYWQFIRRIYFYDPAPALRKLELPVLALFGELDNNVLAEKNRAAWEAALEAGGHRDYTLVTLPRANHLQLEARNGTNAEMSSLRRFVPEYSTTITRWLSKRVPGFVPDQ